MWAYASLFWAHALVGACLVFAFASALKLGESRRERSGFWAWGVSDTAWQIRADFGAGTVCLAAHALKILRNKLAPATLIRIEPVGKVTANTPRNVC